MAEKITIALPEELFKRLQAVKDRFNISGVCQEALAAKIEIEELYMKGSEKMEDVIGRLKAEKKELEKEWYDTGFKDALENAKKMSYAELKEIFGVHAYDQEAQLSYADYVYNTDLLKHNDWLCKKVEELEEENGDFSEEQYLNGWVTGVLKFWDEVSEKL